MSNDGYIDFTKRVQEVLQLRASKKGVNQLVDNYEGMVQYSPRLSVLLRRTIENLDEELNRFEKFFVSSGCKILWAHDYDDIFSQLLELMDKSRQKSVSIDEKDRGCSLFEEVGLKYFVESHKIVDNENGFYQLIPANMMISESGSLLLMGRDQSYFKRLNNHRVNVFFTTINNILPSLSDIDLYTRTYNASSAHTGNNSSFLVYNGSSINKTYLFIIDNQRTNLLKQRVQRQALTCLNCGLCEKVCPIDNIIGKEPYNNVFTGPIGRVVLPFLEDIDGYKHVVYNCTMCGRCEEVCPIELPIRDMILETRRQLVNDDQLEGKQKLMLSKYRKYMLDRSRMNKSAWMKQQLVNMFLLRDVKDDRKLPEFASRTFNQIFLGKK